MEWERDKKFTNVWHVIQEFNGFKYEVVAVIEQTDKVDKFWFSAGSGKKRKELSVWEEKDKKSLGGIHALIWIKNMILSFPEYYTNSPYGRSKKRRYLCIGWSDSKRRNIYERLLKYGFVFQMEQGSKILIKKF
ncbi:MAG: hypothetical protein V4666_08095 [Bacteroidota bacterium]